MSVKTHTSKKQSNLQITPMLSSLVIMENANSESEVLGLGISVIALNLAMYLGVPAVVVVGIKKKKLKNYFSLKLFISK